MVLNVRSIYDYTYRLLQNKSGILFSRRYVGAYDGDGKTIASVINKKNKKDTKLLMLSLNQNGFSLTNGALIFGSCILFPNYLLSWNVNYDNEINEKSLDFFFHLQPKLHVLVIGIADKAMLGKVSKLVLTLAVKHKMNIEVQDVITACGTYNFLAKDNLHVAGAFIPPLNYEFGLDDIKFTKDKYNVLEGSHMRGGEPWL